MHDDVSSKFATICEPSCETASLRFGCQQELASGNFKALIGQTFIATPEAQLNGSKRKLMASEDERASSSLAKAIDQEEAVDAIVKMEQQDTQKGTALQTTNGNHLNHQQDSGSPQDLNGLEKKHQPQQASMCAGCSGPIRDKFLFSVIDLLWHQDCVQCSDCSLKLHERCFTFNGKLYCHQDYWHRFGPKCFACCEPINKSELVQRIKGNRVYHLKCFTCSQCHRRLERGEQLHLIDDKRLLCKQDYQQAAIQSPNNNNNLKKQLKHGNNNGFSRQDNATTTISNNNINSSTSSYFTLLSSNQSGSAKSSKRSSLTSLDNMLDERQRQRQRQRKRKRQQQQSLQRLPGDLDEVEMQLEDGLEEVEEAAEEQDEMIEAISGEAAHDNGTGVQDQDEDEGDEELDEDDDMLHHVDEEEDDEEGDEDDDEIELNSSTAAAFRNEQVGNNNHLDLENEENRTTGGAINSSLGQQQQASGKTNSSNKTTPTSAKRRRRRRRAIDNGKQQDSKELSSGKLAAVANSNKGKSILNGDGQSASILAGMPTGAQALKCFSGSSSASSAGSTSSNHSTSSTTNSNTLGGGSATVHHHQNHHHHHQQQAHHLNNSGGGGHQQQHNSQSTGAGGGGHKPTRVRTVLNEKQLQTLRDCYAHNPRPDALMKEQLVDMTGLSPRVIRVWFQNKRCKDKKKSILYKQMQQHEKDGRHLAGLTHIRGVPLVASSPIQYQEEHSAAAAAANAPNDSPSQQSVQSPSMQHLVGGAPLQQGPNGQPQQQHSPGMDIRAYQPPWKSLVDYAQQQQPPPPQGKQQAAAAAAAAGQQPDRLNAASPRYQQLIGQIHGYGTTNGPNLDQLAAEPPIPDNHHHHHQVLELHPPSQQQQQQQYVANPNLMLSAGGPVGSHQHSPTAAGNYASAMMAPPLPPQHLHAHLTQIGAGPTQVVAPPPQTQTQQQPSGNQYNGLHEF